MYYEIAEGTPKNRNVLVEEKDLIGYIHACRERKRELYRSYYLYDDNIKKHFETRKTVRNYSGNFFIRQLVFDIDKGNDTHDFVLIRAREFVKVLNEDWDIPWESIDLWYSGRGYHIVIPNIFKFIGSNNLPNKWVATAKKYFPEVDTAPFTATGLIRIGHTINTKSMLYKTRLTDDEFLQMKYNDIYELAKAGEIRDIPPVKLETNLDYSDQVVEVAEVKKTVTQNFTGDVTCMQKLYARGPEKGRRHKDLMRMISSYRRKGLPQDAVLAIMVDWADNMDLKEVTKYVNDVYKKDYKFGCFDEVMVEFCDPKCLYFKHKDFQNEFQTAAQMEKNYAKFIRQDFTSKMIDLGEIFHLAKPFKIYPGEYVILLGDVKLGKSATVQNIAIELPDMKIDYYSTEMNARLVYRRNCQIAYGKSKSELEEYYMYNDNTLSDRVEHIECLPAQPDLGALERMIVERNPDLVIIDTIKSLRTGRLEEFSSKEEKLATLLTSIAQKNDVIIFGVHHIPKAKAGRRLNIHSGYGSGAIEQLADKVLGFEGEERKTVRTLRTLGSRDEEPFEVQLNLNKNTFKLTKLMEIKIK